jgi:hypothetical protein
VRRRGHEVRLGACQPQVTPQDAAACNTSERDDGNARQRHRDVHRPLPSNRIVERRLLNRYERHLPSRQPRAGSNRFPTRRNVGWRGDEDDAGRRDLVQVVVHQRFEAPGPIEPDRTSVARGQCPHVAEGGFAKGIRSRRRAFCVEEIDRQAQRRLGREKHVRSDRSQPLHESKTFGSRQRLAIVVQTRRQGLDSRGTRRPIQALGRHDRHLELAGGRSGSRAIGVLDAPLGPEQHGALGELSLDQSKEPLLGRARAIEARGLVAPVRVDARAHEAKLAAIGVEHPPPAGLGLRGDRLVHEPQDARRRQERRHDEQDEQPDAAIQPVSRRSELESHLTRSVSVFEGLFQFVAPAVTHG